MSAAEFDEPGRVLDLSSAPELGSPSPARSSAETRDFVGIRFTCCDVYTRVYLDQRREAHVVRCPRCGRPLRLQFDPHGSTARFFEAS